MSTDSPTAVVDAPQPPPPPPPPRESDNHQRAEALGSRQDQWTSFDTDAPSSGHRADDAAPARPDDPTAADTAGDLRPEGTDRAELGLGGCRLTTPAGEAFYAPDDACMRESALSVGPMADAFTVDMHGDPGVVACGDQSYSPKELADFLKSDDSAWSGEPVRLISCETGKGDEPFAQHLADELGQDVLAPTELAWSDASGAVYSSTGTHDEYGAFVPTDPPDGQWLVFSPRDKENVAT